MRWSILIRGFGGCCARTLLVARVECFRVMPPGNEMIIESRTQGRFCEVLRSPRHRFVPTGSLHKGCLHGKKKQYISGTHGGRGRRQRLPGLTNNLIQGL
jgi:hypothetical protein